MFKVFISLLFSVSISAYPPKVLKPNLNTYLAKKIHKHLSKCDALDYNIFLAILDVESGMKINPKHINPDDVGISGINMKWWKAPLNIDEQRLRQDVGYAIDLSCEILKIKKKESNKNDKFWWANYHNRKEPFKSRYIDLIMKRVRELNNG